MRDCNSVLKSMRICLAVDRDSNCLSECFGCNYISHDHHVMDMVRDAADAIEELLAHACPHYHRNVHDRGDDSYCDVLNTEPPKEDAECKN